MDTSCSSENNICSSENTSGATYALVVTRDKKIATSHRQNGHFVCMINDVVVELATTFFQTNFSDYCRYIIETVDLETKERIEQSIPMGDVEKVDAIISEVCILVFFVLFSHHVFFW